MYAASAPQPLDRLTSAAAGRQTSGMSTAGKKRSREFPFITVEVAAERGELLITALWEGGTVGVEEMFEEASEGCVRLKAYFEDKAAQHACLIKLSKVVADAEIVTRGKVRVDDWISLLHGGFEPVAVGPFLVVPAGPAPPPVSGARLLRIKAGMGFGTGSHPTTRQSLEFICELVKPGMSVFDLGTGSGILAIAAAMLGARPVLAVDNDPDSVWNASENLAINDVAQVVELTHGSIERAEGRVFDLIAANILTGPLLSLFSRGLAALLAPGGALIISGFPPDECDRMEGVAAIHGLELAERRTRGDWAAMLLRKPRQAG
jgi:ribosomal protein L11 methyltransferase